MLLYSFVLPIEGLFELVPQHRMSYLERLVAAGLPVAVRDVIVALLDCETTGALEVLNRWESQS